MQSTIERLSEEALFNAQSEVGKLIGTDIEFRLKSASLIKKQGYLESLDNRKNIVSLKIRGTYEGEGCLLFTENSVVRLGGKMLMLPPSEINEIISNADFKVEDEFRYAFDEIAKCLVMAFLEPFQHSTTFISTITCQTQKIADGKKEIVETLSHLPAEQTYYEVTAATELAGVGANDFSLLLPAFVLVCSEQFQKHTGELSDSFSPDSVEHEFDQPSIFAPLLSTFSNGDKTTSREGTAWHLFAHLFPVLESELANFLGSRVEIKEKTSGTVRLNELFKKPQDASLLTTELSITGPRRGRGWLIAEMADATRLGMLMTDGSLAGLIPISLTAPFSADCQDGYREICSIFLDLLFSVCQDLSDGTVVLERQQSTLVEKEHMQSYFYHSDSGPDYKLSSLEITVNSITSGTMHLLLLDDILKEFNTKKPPAMEIASSSLRIDSTEKGHRGIVLENVDQKRMPEKPPSVLIIEVSETHSQELLNALAQGGIEANCISVLQELQKKDLESYQAVILEIGTLDEIVLGLVIKIKSLVAVPLLVAASQWTQTDVMKALRYGVDDIVMCPVESEELVHKLKGLELMTI